MGIADDVRNVRFSYDHDYPLSDLQGFYGLTFSLLGLLKSVSVHLQPLINLTATPEKRNYIIILKMHGFIINFLIRCHT